MKRLWLLLLPAGAGLVVWVCAAAVDNYLLLTVSLMMLPVLLGFSVQAVALFFARRAGKWLRFATLGLLLIPVAGAAYEASRQGMFWQLGALIWLAGAVLYLPGWGAAWALERTRHE